MVTSSKMNLLEESLPDNHAELNVGRVRNRKMAIGHHSNSLLFDANGNTHPSFHHLDRVTENTLNMKDEEKNNSDLVEGTGNRADRNSILWETTVLQQIQCLIQHVQVSDSLVDFINTEFIGTDNKNGNFEHRTRRKSCFSTYDQRHGQPSRRQSVTALCQNKSKSLPRTNLNTGDFGLPHFHNGRRSSVVQTNGRRSSVVSHNRERRNSVAHPGILVTCPSSRRNSTAHVLPRRRSSLAHAYHQSLMSPIRKMSVTHDSLVSGSTNVTTQRRRSSVKPPCFPVTKISSVQKRLHQIYNRRRRRYDRAEVKMADVRKAFKQLRKRECGGVSESDKSEHSNVQSFSNSDAEEVGEISSPDIQLDNLDGSESSGKVLDNEAGGMTLDMSVLGESENGDINKEPRLEPRRKTSIQVRAWELSRKLRQRRRQKRQGFQESCLI